MARGGWEGEGVEERGLGGGLRGCRNGLGAVTAGYTCRWGGQLCLVVLCCFVLFCVVLGSAVLCCVVLCCVVLCCVG